MIDNSWMSDDKSRNAAPGSNILRTKVIITAMIILIGGGLTILMNGVGSNTTLYQSEGIVIDFGDYHTEWVDADFHESSDPLELLDKACTALGYTHSFTGGKVTEIAGVTDSADMSWNLWYVPKGDFDAVRSDSYGIDASRYTVTMWAYTSSDGVPAVAVDATATSIYGYAQVDSTVTLSPVCTELVSAVHGINTVVGTDVFSNYPSRIREGHEDGTISIVGTYTDPSYESIIGLSPSLVICDGSQYSHVQMAQSVRNSSINAVVVYNGESIDTILKNIFIVGTAMKYPMAATSAIHDLEAAVAELSGIVASEDKVYTMIALSSDPSPFVAGSRTYADDILETMEGSNVFSYLRGWKNINTEYILKSNPSLIIIISSEPYYSEHNGSYEKMLEQMSPQWKKTDAYQSGEIYLLCESLGEMAQRSGPRFAQFMEIMGRILHPDAFTDGITVPKCIGDSYLDYLTITKSLGMGD